MPFRSPLSSVDHGRQRIPGLAGGLSLRKYVEGTALDGLYLGGAATVAYVNAYDAYESAPAAVVALGSRSGDTS